ncbi:MerR family transcriptional regulator [Lachnobacterium bovis]|uniref:DNA-binding transcriptional regulator, MerR family n=1 Tax=Lachnobacterium bovis DSM 14045 TaxID=1122142 RepID=A0A1H3L2Y1_9FIRM|nr:MerR family transcriptional regulator [Lachnobacterium bovis]SDY58264.1 DNA-binding transcriptional regulator, MerR family [Lachnobacterium bovis DSM 14045]SFG84596.1 DNA-binding transcriptional regulator, MerR family [Lachnospiraceae bacterium C7]
MKTVNEVSKLTGVSRRTLQYYDKIGLLRPTEYTESGYRLYDDAALERLQQILLFRELEFPLKDIKDIVTRSDFDKKKALDQQMELLELKKEHIENLINMCRGLKMRGVKNLEFKAFDTRKIEEYSQKAKEQWKSTPEYKEYEEKSKSRTKADEKEIMKDLMKVFEEFGTMKEKNPASQEVQDQVKKLQNFITDYFYNCTDETLFGLGKMYAGGGEFTENIDKMGGTGTAEFTYQAIKIYCNR